MKERQFLIPIKEKSKINNFRVLCAFCGEQNTIIVALLNCSIAKYLKNFVISVVVFCKDRDLRILIRKRRMENGERKPVVYVFSLRSSVLSAVKKVICVNL